MSLRYRDLPEIPANQLRPGNIVTTGQAQVTVKSVSENHCKVVFQHPKNGDYLEVRNLSELRPVVVNEYRIKQLGLHEVYHKIFQLGKTGYRVKYDGEDSFKLYDTWEDYTIAEGTFLHHLQNLINDLSIKIFTP